MSVAVSRLNRLNLSHHAERRRDPRACVNRVNLSRLHGDARATSDACERLNRLNLSPGLEG
jgi:hypothetical protein